MVCTGAFRLITAYSKQYIDVADGYTVVEHTGSLLTSEVKRHRARLVLGWGTAWEDLWALSAFRKRLPLAPRLSQSRQRQCFHRSHFGSRYKLGYCGNASLFFYLHCFANFLMRAHVCSVALTRCLLTLTTMWLAPFKVVSSQTASLFSL